MTQDLIEIDGSVGEAGGQILRTACALSAITKKSCRVFNIRRGRSNPGLMPQHLLGIRALSQLCGARLEGDELSSQEIKFYPSEIKTKHITIKIKTASSIPLLLQTLVLPSLFAPSPVKITFIGGATDTFFSPTIDYFQHVFLRILEKINGKVEIDISRRGYYPEGGASVEVKIFPQKIKNLNLIERGEIDTFYLFSGASTSLREKKVAERQAAGVREVMGALKLPFKEKISYYPTDCPGSQVCLAARFDKTFIGTDNLGKFGKRAEDVGKEAALEMLQEEKSQAALDKYMADQILPYLTLVDSKSHITVSEITPHCRTNIWIIEKFIKGRFETKENLITWIPADSIKKILKKEIL